MPEPRKFGEMLFPWLAGVVVGRINAFYGAMILGVAGLVLTVAWHAGPHKFLDARQFAALTSRADARIVESWLAVEFDPAAMGSYTNWRAFAKASPCVVVEYQTEWTGPAHRAFCGVRLPFYDHYTLHDIVEIAPGVPFLWARDERGFIVPEIRVSPAAYSYFSKGGFVFLRAAREAVVDPGAPQALRDQARRFLEVWVTQPVEDPWPKDPGFTTRVRLLRELTTIPQPNAIAIPASWIVERAEKRRLRSP